MQHLPFKAMTITSVPSPLIPPPDPCHERSTRLSLNVLRSPARAAAGFHVRGGAEENAEICLFEQKAGAFISTALNSGAGNGPFLFRGLLSKRFTFYRTHLKCLLGKSQAQSDRAERVRGLRVSQKKKGNTTCLVLFPLRSVHCSNIHHTATESSLYVFLKNRCRLRGSFKEKNQRSH